MLDICYLCGRSAHVLKCTRIVLFSVGVAPHVFCVGILLVCPCYFGAGLSSARKSLAFTKMDGSRGTGCFSHTGSWSVAPVGTKKNSPW